VTKKEAAQMTGFGERYLRRVLQKGSSFVPGRNIATRKERAMLDNGRTLQITLISRKDLEEFIRNRAVCLVPEGRVALREAARILGLKYRTVGEWCRSGCPHLDGRKLDVVKGPVKHGKQIQPSVLLLLPEVQHILRKILDSAHHPFTNDQGRWWPADLAVREFANARIGLLYLHKNKRCPQLDGKVLHAIKIDRITPKTHRKAKTWAFLEADLTRLAPPQLGGRPCPKDAQEAALRNHD
jgi:hypothetical protein